MATIPQALTPIVPSAHTFATPAKRIHTHDDLPLFHASSAYELITSFLVHLNSSVCPVDATTNAVRDPAEYATDSTAITVSPDVQKILTLIHDLEQLIPSAPPDTGPRRFGNVAFRKWHALVKEHLGVDSDAQPALSNYLPDAVLSATSSGYPATSEILQYLAGSFGSPERLDYGTGHELSFAAFLCGIWVIGGFKPGRDEKALVLRCFDAYFRLIRRLVKTYSLEPAGSHGVWGLDDHSFLPYIFGSSQLTTYRPVTDAPGDDFGLPKPTDVVKQDVVERERERNLYFGAIGFIYDVKKGPFWEHSPILFDISGVQKGWGKINEGMLKMYDKEVLGKFPVVQHFPFGSIFRWVSTESGADLLTRHSSDGNNSRSSIPPLTKLPMESTKAPWASSSATTSKSGEEPLTKAPWAAPNPPPFPTSAEMQTHRPSPIGQLDTADTKAPWATESSSGEHTENPPQPTEARLGPKRTSSPDAMLNPDVKTRERRGSVSTGGVRVAETGDLSRRRPSQTS